VVAGCGSGQGRRLHRRPVAVGYARVPQPSKSTDARNQAHRTSRSVLGPQPKGEPRTTAGRNGHRVFGEAAGRSTYSLLTSGGGDRRSGVRVSPPMAAMACQRFARDDASVCHACLRVAAWAEPVDLGERGGTDGEAQGFEVAARAWHARGQGFKSPQLHPMSAALSALDRPRIPALAQQIRSNCQCVADAVRPGRR